MYNDSLNRPICHKLLKLAAISSRLLLQQSGGRLNHVYAQPAFLK